MRSGGVFYLFGVMIFPRHVTIPESEIGVLLTDVYDFWPIPDYQAVEGDISSGKRVGVGTVGARLEPGGAA
jgi:hypothetical protein